MTGAQAQATGATYRVLRELGRRAQHTFAAVREPHELVVVQRFVRTPTLGGAPLEGVTNVSAEAMAILLRDARCLAKNWHPNIARVRHVDLVGSELFVSSELVEGVTLADLLEAATAQRARTNASASANEGEPLLPLPVLARILVDVLGGLHGLHGLRDGMNAPLGVFHAALCPANVVIGRDGVARIVAVFRSRPSLVRERSEALGYAAPEALEGIGASDARADLYAIGAMLWEGLAGRRLYPDGDPAQIQRRQREEELVRPHVPGTSGLAELADIAMRAIAYDPALRYRTASEIATQIRRVTGTQLAPGSAVAQLVADLAGERIRARRAELDMSTSGTRRRSSNKAVRAVKDGVAADASEAADGADPSDATPAAAIAMLPIPEPDAGSADDRPTYLGEPPPTLSPAQMAASAAPPKPKNPPPPVPARTGAASTTGATGAPAAPAARPATKPAPPVPPVPRATGAPTTRKTEVAGNVLDASRRSDPETGATPPGPARAEPAVRPSVIESEPPGPRMSSPLLDDEALAAAKLIAVATKPKLSPLTPHLPFDTSTKGVGDIPAPPPEAIAALQSFEARVPPAPSSANAVDGAAPSGPSAVVVASVSSDDVLAKAPDDEASRPWPSSATPSEQVIPMGPPLDRRLRPVMAVLGAIVGLVLIGTVVSFAVTKRSPPKDDAAKASATETTSPAGTSAKTGQPNASPTAVDRATPTPTPADPATAPAAAPTTTMAATPADPASSDAPTGAASPRPAAPAPHGRTNGPAKKTTPYEPLGI